MEYITMNKKELEQSKVFAQVKEGLITKVEAAARLKITDRWVREKFKRYEQSEAAGLIHQNRGRVSPQRWDKEQEQLLIELLQGEWQGFGPTFAAEKLEEIHAIKVSKETVRTVMIKAAVWQPKKQRRKHRKRRERRSMVGMMVQLDGSPHDWFEGRAKICTLLVFIDDATSQILWLEFVDSESVMALMQATKKYVQKHGIPQSFYTDHGSVFHVNLNNQENDKKTQWERSCAALNINVIHANSPQAKGRVERCNQTMQDRLIKEMRLAQISSINAANDYLKTSGFIEKHNTKFAVTAMQKGDAHAALQRYNVSDIFSMKETRVLAHDFTITFNKRIFQLDAHQATIIRPKNEIVVTTHLDESISLSIRQIQLNFDEILSRPIKHIQEKKISDRKPQKPPANSRRWASGLAPLLQESRMKPALPAAEALL